MNRLLQELWMTMSEEQRFLTCGGIHEAEKAILESLAPSEYSPVEIREFVFYHMHGYPLPPEAVIQMRKRFGSRNITTR